MIANSSSFEMALLPTTWTLPISGCSVTTYVTMTEPSGFGSTWAWTLLNRPRCVMRTMSFLDGLGVVRGAFGDADLVVDQLEGDVDQAFDFHFGDWGGRLDRSLGRGWCWL